MVKIKKLIVLLLLLIQPGSGQEWIALKNKTAEYTKKGDYKSAYEYAQSAVKKADSVYGRHSITYSISLCDLALIKQKQGEFSEAENLLLQALEIRRQKPKESSSYIPVSLHNLACLYNEMGQYEKARQYCIQSIEARQQFSPKKDKEFAAALNLLAVIYQNLGLQFQADSLYNESASILQSTDMHENSSEHISQLSNMATRQFMERNYAKAEELFIKAMQSIEVSQGKEHPDYTILLNNLASLYKQTGQFDKAESYYTQVLDIRKKNLNEYHPDISLSLGNLAALYAEQCRTKEAKQYYLEQNRCLLAQIRAYFPVFSEEEKSEFWKSKKDEIERFYAFVLAAMNNDSSLIGEMYNLQLATKAVLLDASNKVRARILNSGDEQLMKMFRKWHANKEMLSKLYYQRRLLSEGTIINADSIERETEYIEKQLNQKSDAFAKEYEKREIKWKEVQEKLEPEEAAIEIIRFHCNKMQEDKVFYTGLILTGRTKDHPDITVYDEGNSLEKEYYSNYFRSIRSDQNDSYSYEYFWSKFADKLKGIKKIYLSCDGVYNQINIRTLMTPSGSYLGDSLDVILVTNTKDILEIKNNLPHWNMNDIKRNNGKTIALFGNPDFDMKLQSFSAITDSSLQTGAQLIQKENIKFESLPGTKKEITCIGNMMKTKGWEVNIFSETEATEENLKLIKSPAILHIATHGYFEDMAEIEDSRGEQKQNPFLKSKLILAGANYSECLKGLNTDDGILTASEAMNLNLDNTDLVILSACQTGTGEVVNGEGIYGLQRAFQLAGARTVVMSLWQVEDQFTKDFMILIYKNMIEDNDIRKAFKRSIDEIKKIYTSPKYWGAFLILGI